MKLENIMKKVKLEYAEKPVKHVRLMTLVKIVMLHRPLEVLKLQMTSFFTAAFPLKL